MVEHLLCKQDVRGSTPLVSTQHKTGDGDKHLNRIGQPTDHTIQNKGVSMGTEATAEEIVNKAKYELTNMIGTGIIDLGRLRNILDGH